MTIKEKKDRLCEGIISGEKLVTSKLNSWGLTSKDIADLIQEEILKREGRGLYSFIGFNDLYEYGKTLNNIGNEAKARICFEKCYKIKRNHSGVAFFLFFYTVENEEYDKVFEYFDIIYQNADKSTISDITFYLYLLSSITAVPKKYHEEIRYMKYEDIRIDSKNKRNPDIKEKNEVRKFAFNREYELALKRIKQLNILNVHESIKDKLIRILIERANKKNGKLKHQEVVSSTSKITFENIIKYLALNKLEKAIETLREFLKNINQEKYEFLIISLLNISLLEHDDKFTKPKMVFNAIRECNFELDLSEYIQCARDEISKNNIEKSRVYLNIVSKYDSLGQFNDLINEIEKLIKHQERGTHNEVTNDTLNVDELYNDGRKLIAEERFDEADDCFQKCYKLNPKHLGVIFYLFFKSIKNKNYDKAFEYFDILYQSDDQLYISEHNFYLYLLSFITPIPEKYQEIIKNLKFEDMKILLEDNRYEDNELNNKVRLSAFNKSFEYALSQFYEVIAFKKETIQDNLIKILLNEVILQHQKVQNEIVDFLRSGDIEKAFEILKMYLDSLGLIKYETLIINLIKISLIEGDNSFKRPMSVLGAINNKFRIHMSDNIKHACRKISERKFEEARIYIDILSTYNTSKRYGFLINKLENLLVKIQKNDNNEEARVSSDTQDLFLEDNIQEYLNKQLEILPIRGLIILKPVSLNNTIRIFEILEGNPNSNFKLFTIEENNSERIVLKYHSPNLEKIDASALASEGVRDYENGHYDLCIEKLRQALEIFKNPKNFIYAYLGLAYIKKFETEMAIDFLTVAMEANKSEDRYQFDFTHLINRLKENNNSNIYMTESDFITDANDYYGISNIFEIAELMSNGNSLEDACHSYGLNDEEILLVYLIFAREYYSQGNYTIGDSYMKFVERTKNKSEKVKSVFDEIRKNKKFYNNRVREESSRLLSRLKSAKKIRL